MTKSFTCDGFGYKVTVRKDSNEMKHVGIRRYYCNGVLADYACLSHVFMAFHGVRVYSTFAAINKMTLDYDALQEILEFVESV